MRAVQNVVATTAVVPLNGRGGFPGLSCRAAAVCAGREVLDLSLRCRVTLETLYVMLKGVVPCSNTCGVAWRVTCKVCAVYVRARILVCGRECVVFANLVSTECVESARRALSTVMLGHWHPGLCLRNNGD